ncbi:hypothetical protein FRC03_007590 [Tulasnella sp. 419]|nr:hypothetical protein FRC03_007590 [Tulasnella sp. 419]
MLPFEAAFSAFDGPASFAPTIFTLIGHVRLRFSTCDPSQSHFGQQFEIFLNKAVSSVHRTHSSLILRPPIARDSRERFSNYLCIFIGKNGQMIYRHLVRNNNKDAKRLRSVETIKRGNYATSEWKGSRGTTCVWSRDETI